MKWKHIKGYDVAYKVSTAGEVLDCNTGLLLKHYKLPTGYHFVVLKKNGKRPHVYVHRLVACAFIPNPLKKPTVDHIDTNKDNNSVSNLRWATGKENSNNPKTISRMCKYKLHGENMQDVARRNGIDPKSARARIALGWTVEEACTLPITGRRKNV